MALRKHYQFSIAFLVGLIVACLWSIERGSVPSPLGADSASARTTTITVSAAASLQNTLEAIAPQFRAAHADIAVDYNFGSSGALQRQIEQGAPADVFFSAATKQMDALAAKELILTDSRQSLVSNSLVLIAPTASPLDITDISQLRDIEIRHFAVGEFRSVPAGQYAEQVFDRMGLLELLRPTFVFGNNVRSTLAAVASGNAELGMVYATDAALSDRVQVLATAPAGSHKPIVYPIATTHSSPHPDAAQTFIDFLTADTAREIFADFGFGPIPPSL
ncbi:molybdate ABC transporter substrate-binding protein [Synechococcus sp. PCC 7336]|uniref:molybdate ABC transporter substrate-binding protein n=1 Tax=Synechococcus sp. PCC 7336 TaxID=195250 RepID=UPI00034B2D26|nr:molybdate ABC transporter substrate-binding protein [Synechococcus sp. PCC 7336]